MGEERSRHRGLLKQYYKEDPREEGFDPYNINAPEFNPDLYLHKMLKECNLPQLMSRESQVFRQIQALDSEMQTLVYENYNKFIAATDTIRKMKNDFKKMEEEMESLSTNMSRITEFSGNISSTLQGRRQQISKLSSVHILLKKLQFLFELPPGLKACIENGSYHKAVRCYLKAQRVLEQYAHLASFRGIQADCELLVAQLKDRLHEQFAQRDASSSQLSSSVELLLQLGEPTELLCEHFLQHAKEKLDVDLCELESHLDYSEKSSDLKRMDILEFIDLSYNNFVSNLSLVIASYWDLFLSSKEERRSEGVAMRKLDTFVLELMERYFLAIEARFSQEDGDEALIVRALDRFYRRVQAINRLLPHVDFSARGVCIAKGAARGRCGAHLRRLEGGWTVGLVGLRQAIAEGATQHLLSDLESQVDSALNAAQAHLQLFIGADVSFGGELREEFGRELVREGVVLAFFRHISRACRDFCGNSEKSAVPSQLILILSRFCLNLEQSSINKMMALVDENFGLSSGPVPEMCAEMRETAQNLIDHYVKIQGLNISQMLRKSVETRDWLNALEPRTVRAVMKRVVEEATALDALVSTLYEEGTRADRSSDHSSRHLRSNRRHNTPSTYAPSLLDNSLMSNIQKLFSEKIEIFSTVEFSKVSVLTGIIKISLKTFLECVRLRTFSKFGLQQVQVDIHYLQLYLWHFVADENLVHVLLEEILSSAINRCLDPVLMEHSVVDVICERS